MICGYHVKERFRKIKIFELLLNLNHNKMADGKESIIDMRSVTTASEELEIPRAYSDTRRALKKNHPLNYLIEYQREDLITHPLIIGLYSSKWNKFGRYIYYADLSIYILFLTLLNIHAYALPPPFSVEPTQNNCSAGLIQILDEPAAISIYGTCYEVPGYMNWSRVVILVLIGLRSQSYIIIYNISDISDILLLRRNVSYLEIIEMVSRGLFEYWLDLTNMLEWTCYVLSVIFVLDFGPSDNLGVKEPWQWECGAVAVWLAWMVLLLFIQKVPIFGIYILMFVTVIKTFFRFLFVFGLFIAAFSFSFYMLLQNQETVL